MKFINIEEKRVGHRGGGGGRSRMSDDEIRMSITIGSAKQKFPACRLVIGCHPIDHLRWLPNDKISIVYNDTHLFIKRDKKGSYQVQKIQNSGHIGRPHHRFGFPCFPDMPFADVKESVTSVTVQWIYDDGGLLIEWPKGERNGS